MAVSLFLLTEIEIEMTIHTEVVVENLNLISIQFHLGAGGLRVHGQGSLDQKDQRTVTRWLFVNVREEQRNVLIRPILL
jgi:hypothetical protein